MLFLVGSCPSEVIKLDLSRAAQRLDRAFIARRARAELLRQRHRDHLHPGRGRLPRRAGAADCRRPRRTRRRRCSSSARCADVVEDQFARLFRDARHRRVRFFPPRHATELPAVGPNTRFLLAQPFLADTARALEARGATHLPAPFPLGAEGTTAWLQAAADAFGVDAGAVRRRSPRPGRERARIALAAAARACWPASASSSSPTRSSRCRWRASWRANWACSSSRSARPTCTAQHLADELALLPEGTVLSRRPGRRQAARPLPRRPARPRRLRPRPRQSARGRGLHHQVVDRARVHARCRATSRPPTWPSCSPARWCAARKLRAPEARMQLTLWTYEGPPHVGAMRIATAMQRRALRAARAAGRHLRRPAVHDDRAAPTAPAGHLHHLPGARPRRRHRRAVQDRRARGLRALQAAGACWSAPRAPPS